MALDFSIEIDSEAFANSLDEVTEEFDNALETALIPNASNAELNELLTTGLKIF